MSNEDFYKFFREEQNKANALAREVARMARERKVRIPILMRSLCEEYAADEADIAERGAYDGGYERGLSDGRESERQGW